MSTTVTIVRPDGNPVQNFFAALLVLAALFLCLRNIGVYCGWLPPSLLKPTIMLDFLTDVTALMSLGFWELSGRKCQSVMIRRAARFTSRVVIFASLTLAIHAAVGLWGIAHGY